MDYQTTHKALAALEREGVGLASQRFDFDGLEVSVVTPQMLYEMKKGTVRPQDHGDAERLRQRFGLGD